MAHDIKVGVSGDAKVVHSVEGRASIVTPMNRIVPHVGFRDAAQHMEMDWVLAEEEGLANIVELDVLDAAN